MSLQIRRTVELRPHNIQGNWLTNDRTYRVYAHDLLSKLEDLCLEIKAMWPAEEIIRDKSKHESIWKLARERDITSDTIRIYSAMAVEGFLNFYGVLRLGEELFDEHFERLSLVSKAKALLLVCDSLQIDKRDPLLVALEKVAQSRNLLVHPKAKEFIEGSNIDRTIALLPVTARESVANMEKFFDEFKSAVPGSAGCILDKPVMSKQSTTEIDK